MQGLDMNSALKAGIIVIYLLAVASVAGWLPPEPASTLRRLAAVLLALHLLEVALAFKYIRRHPGPLVDSVGLTLLFGFLHWLPLKKAA
jgi:hypothetical protein